MDEETTLIDLLQEIRDADDRLRRLADSYAGLRRLADRPDSSPDFLRFVSAAGRALVERLQDVSWHAAIGLLEAVPPPRSGPG